MAPPVQPIQIVLTAPEKPNEPPRVAVATALHVVSDLVIISFAHPNVFDPPVEGNIKAQTFSQVALPRSSFAQFLRSALTIISDLPDRETFGWNELRELANKAPQR